MDTTWKTALWQQFGAAIDTLGNAIEACPDEVWGDRSRQPEYWYTVYHTLFNLDYYLSDSYEGFAPPAPFGLEEMDPAGVLPPRPAPCRAVEPLAAAGSGYGVEVVIQGEGGIGAGG